MCLSPTKLGELVVACRKCPRCRYNREKDLVGRCIAEGLKKTVTAFYLTLTYADSDNPNSATLVPKDFSDFVRKVRRKGYTLRFIVAGEYGPLRGRSHWHCVLFFDGVRPNWPDALEVLRVSKTGVKMYHLPEWSDLHGHVTFEPVTTKSFQYLVKYMHKDNAKDKQSYVSYSTKPPLGIDYFLRLAEQHVDEGTCLQNYEYSFPHILQRSKNVRVKFWLQGAVREAYMERYLTLWAAKRPHQPIPQSELMEKHFDEVARREIEADPLWRPWSDKFEITWKVYFSCDTDNPQARLVFYTNGRVHWQHHDKEGNSTWHVNVEPNAVAIKNARHRQPPGPKVYPK